MIKDLSQGGGAAVRVEVENNIAKFEAAQFMRGANTAMGKGVEIQLRRFFAAKPTNARGWRSTGFWKRRIRNATQFTSADDKGATITIADQAMNQKIHGGQIVPREKKFLTIPARPECAGRSPRTFSNLQFIPLNDFARAQNGGKLVGLLVEKNADTGRLRRTKGAGRTSQKTRLKVMFYCVASVWQAPDRTALPSGETINAWASDELDKYGQRALKRGGSKS